MTTLCQNLEIGQRWAHWLRQEYPSDAAKLIARDFDVSISTSTRWIGGTVPTTEYLTIAAKRWGWRFVNFLYGKLPIPSEMEIEARLREAEVAVERALHTLKEIRNEGVDTAAGDRAGFSNGSSGSKPLGLGARPLRVAR